MKEGTKKGWLKDILKKSLLGTSHHGSTEDLHQEFS